MIIIEFSIDSRIFEKFPDLNIGIVAVKGMNNVGSFLKE